MKKQLANRIEKVIQRHFSSEYALHLNRPLVPAAVEDNIKAVIESRDLSSEGRFLEKVEKEIADQCGVKYALCTITGSSALHLALISIGVGEGDEVITSPFSFIATANSIFHTGADPVFVDLEKDHFTLDPGKVRDFLKQNCEIDDSGRPRNKETGKIIKAILPVHVFGHSSDMEGLIELAREFELDLIEDAAQAFGSFQDQKALGSFGKAGVFSFNGNKIITSGQGGCLITNDEYLYKKALLLSNNARIDNGITREYFAPGFNYRMANLNASILAGELEWVKEKISIRNKYQRELSSALSDPEVELVTARSGCNPNHWQTVVRVKDQKARKQFKRDLSLTGIHFSDPWPLICDQKPYRGFQNDGMEVAREIISEIIFLPSAPDLSFKMLPYFRAELAKKG